LQVTGPPLLPAEDEAADEVLAAGAAAGVALPAPAEADLSTPPCPLQAPRPPCGELVPSLQVTGPLLVPEDEEADADGLAAGAADGAALLVAAPLVALAPAEADLLMPPWPLQAPRPPCGDVVPSLQTTAPDALCANEIGEATSRLASATLLIEPMSFVRFICSFPQRVPLIIRTVRILQSLRGGYAAPRGNKAGRGKDVVRWRR
jgi:hypothetical protein